jgi:glycosyltransferase involved in cell wall biosynthesis
MRLAFLSPIPPAPSGIADYAVDVLERLVRRHEVHVFHAQGRVDPLALPLGVRVHHADGFLKRHRDAPFDLAVYQLGNGPAHDFLYPLMPAVPGLLVLHDLVLHHARARAFLDSPEARAYAARPGDAGLREAAQAPLEAYGREVAYCYPEQAGRLDAAHLATVGDLLPYAYPLFRLPVESARLVATHNRFMADAVRDEVAGAEVRVIPMAVERQAVDPGAVRALRARLDIGDDEVVVGSFGLLTREKRIEAVARAVARAAVHVPRVRLLLVGPLPDLPGLLALLSRLGVRERTVLAGRVPLWSLPAHIEAADVVACLRYPTARETSAAVLRVLAQGRPAIVPDLENAAELPEDAVVRADLTDEEGAVARAIVRLAGDARLRERLSAAARRFVAHAHTRARMGEAYEEAIAAAARRPAPDVPAGWPPHWRDAALAR